MTPQRPRRAFTLLEVMLASALGALTILGVMMVLALMDRSDRQLAARFDQAADFQRTQRAIRDAIASLVMSSDPRPPRSPEGGPPAADPSVPPRFILAQDDAPDLAAVLSSLQRLGRIKAAGAPQRLELVVTRPPALPRSVDWSLSAGEPVRGVFELRPAPTAGLSAEDAERAGWQLWWRPLPPKVPAAGESGDEPPPPVGGPTLLASGLSECRWEAFDDRQFKSEHSATWARDLPAYVRLTIATVRGVREEWLFEVGWSSAPEIPEVLNLRPGERPRAPTLPGGGSPDGKGDGA